MRVTVRMLLSVAAVVLAMAFIPVTAGTAGASGPAEHNILPPVATSKPVTGGTLKIVGNGDVDHLDTCCAYYTTTYEILRMVSRQLVSYPASSSLKSDETPVPDLATYSISPNGLTYTFHIKQGAMWDAPTGPRQVTGQDEVNGIKRLCNPVVPAPPLSYWTGNIAGMTAYCTGFSALKLPTDPTAEIAALNSYMSTHNISGVTAPSANTVVFTLSHPSSDFLNILALPMSSPVPVEINQYLPTSIQEEDHFISDGPYTITSYTPNVSYTLAKNPNWNQSSDPIRHQYFNAVDITLGETATSVQQQLQTGGADLAWDTTVPTAQVPSLVATHNKGLVAAFIGGFDYFAFNMNSTTNGGALKKVAVRQALQYCVNKRHIVQVTGGPAINAPAPQILPPQLTGYKAINPYPTTNSEGDPSKCKSLLAKAGYPHGLTLTLTFPDNAPYPALATAVQSDMAAGGVTLKFDEQPTQGAYFSYIETGSNQVHWDLALGLWFPDWQGNGAQSVFSPLLDGRQYSASGSVDYGDYNDATVDKDIDAALTTGSVSKAASDWANGDSTAMTKNPPWIPLTYIALPYMVGANVIHAVYVPFLGYVDPTNLWKS
jgi:ABC-type transport system substrate-binding protein